MRAPIFKQAGWAGLCALILSGCSSTNSSTSMPLPPPPPLPPSPAPVQNPPPASNESVDEGTDAGSGFDNLEIVGAGLNGKLAILRVGSDPSANNLLSVFAGLKNKTTHRLALEMETIYKDKVGDALNAGSWIPVTLKPHEEQEYRSTSISVDGADFLIRVRRAATSK